MPMMYCVVIADFEDVNTCWFVSANLSKDAFYFTYSDIKKQVNLDFIASSLSDTSIVAIFLVSLGVPGNLQYSPEEFCKSTSSRRSCMSFVKALLQEHLANVIFFHTPTP